jgi:hypothetical protein
LAGFVVALERKPTMRTSSQNFRVAFTALLLSVFLVVPKLTGLAQTTNLVLSLDGTSGYVSVPSSPDLQNADEITVEMWIFPLAVDGHGWFLEKGDGGSANSQQSYQLDWVVNGGNTGIGVGAEFSFFLNSSTWVVLGAKLPGSNWVHIAASFNSTSGLFQLFTNGVLASSTTSNHLNTVSLVGQIVRQTTLPVNIGGQVGSPGSTYGVLAHGFLDEVRIWKAARSAQDISATMFCRLTGTEANLAGYWNFDNGTANDLTTNGNNGTLEGNAQIMPIVGNDAVHAGICGLGLPPQSFLTNGLVAYYPFNGNAKDESGNGNDGIIYGAALTVDRFGRTNSAFFFNGTNSYIRIPQSGSLSNLQNTTISYWTKYNKATSGFSDVSTTICNGQDGASPPGFYTYAFSNVLLHILGQYRATGAVGASVSMAFDGTSPLGAQSYIFVTFVANSTNTLVYKNGVLQMAAARQGFGISRPAYDWFIGCTGDFGHPYYLNGMMDDVRIYNRALSDYEVEQLYLYESAPPCIPHTATATAAVTNGSVLGVTIADYGCGYTNTPSVKLIGGGTGAQAVAVVSGGVVIAVNVLNAGSGYADAPLVVIAPPFIEQPLMGIVPLPVIAGSTAQLFQLGFGRLSPYDNYQLEFAPIAGGVWSNFALPFVPTATVSTQDVVTSGQTGFFRVRHEP